MKQPLLEMKDVSLQYGADTEILRNINIKIEKNSFHFLSGDSGEGKTSLLKMIYMNILPTKGSVEILGHNTKNISKEEKIKIIRKIGVVFQDYQLLPQLNAFENVALPLRLRDYNHSDIVSNVQDIIEWVGLTNKIDAYPSNMSGGECQRLAIARAVVYKPDILIADEPTGNIDNFNAIKILHLFEGIMRAQGNAVIFATHNYNLMRSCKYPSLFLEKAQLQYFETPNEIYDKKSTLLT